MPPLAPPPERSCSMCQSEDDSQMVCCDKCHNWFHFDCVGVTGAIAEHPWICPSCIRASTEELPSATGGSAAPSSMLKESGPHVIPLTSAPQISPVPSAPPAQSALPAPSAQPTSLLQLPVDLQLKMLEEEREIERKYLQRKYRLMMEASGGANAQPSTSHVVHDYSFCQPPCHSSPLRPAQPIVPELHLLEGTHGANDTVVLNSSQIAARHAVAKELPIYSGEPEEWPLFIATYENTTRLCGYTPEENMVRLQRCLRGKALEAVKCQLLHPANLEFALSTLKMLFGRPEIIVHTLIEKINRIPAPKADKLSTLVDFALAVRNMVATVRACKLEEHLYNITLLQGLVERLPPMVKLNWATYRVQLPRVSLLEFSDWLYTVAEAASTVTLPTPIACDNKPRRSSFKEDGFLHVHSELSRSSSLQRPRGNCVICHGPCNAVEICQDFLNLDHSDRWASLREHKLCRTCLGTHRGLCRSGDICGRNGCTLKHHRLLHNDRSDNSAPGARHLVQSNPTDNVEPAANPAQYNCNTHRWNDKSVLFQYIPVTLHHNGNTVRTYAFVDCGSHMTLLEEDLAAELSLRGEKHPLCIRWTADHCRFEDTAEKVSLHVSGTQNEGNKYTLSDVFTVKDLKLPPQSLSVSKMCRRYSYLRGLPIESYNNVRPRLLIGMNNVRLGHALDSREGSENEPIATKTRLGWTIFGTCLDDHPKPSTIPYSFHICSHSYNPDDDLHATVKSYFAFESLGITAPNKELLSVDDERAIGILRQNTRLEDGRYSTSLLWKYDDVRLPNNKAMALRRHRCLVKKMKREPTLGETLRKKITDYIHKGFIRKLTPEELRTGGNRVWYLPIFPVFNKNKPNKVRIVWDAAASVAGTSLNSVLLKGPGQLKPLPSVLYKFRERPVAICGDIEEMFHQVRMNEDDQQSQRFLFQDNTDAAEPDEYVMTVMTFGATCSPSSAQFIINKNAERFEKQLPEAVEAIRENHYVDDMLASVNTEAEAIKLAKDVHFIHQEGGFKMRGWISNSPSVMKALKSTEAPERNMDLEVEHALEKVLGMWWDIKSDEFQYKLSKERHSDLLFNGKHPTKRELLSVLMSIYDPLGLIANFLMPLKLLLQEVWRSGVVWDEPIGALQLQKWKSWLTNLPQASLVRIPRCYHLTAINDQMDIELHTFVDASETGYCAVAYLRFQLADNIRCVLVGAKTRVAPITFVSIPRLELQAAVVGTRLAKSIEQGHSIKISRRYFWTDAVDVLCWLRSDHRAYSPFVAYRASEILESTDTSEWKYVPTKENVADEGTKYQRSPRFGSDSRWNKGPEFLWKQETDWPLEPHRKSTTCLEMRPSLLHHSVTLASDYLQAESFSSWRRLLRVTALIPRFPMNIRRKIAGKPISVGPLTSEELCGAELFHYRRAQEDIYSDELALLKSSNGSPNNSTLPKSSSLYKLNPKIDNDGMMRIHGRIDACDYVDEYTKHPIVLPRGHPVTRLLLQDIHERYHHQCFETFVNETRKKFYIPRARSECKKVLSDCQRCKIRRAKPTSPPMGDLPKARLAAFVRPFSYIGVDYFGPYQVTLGRRIEKRWGMLVTCLTVRAIHIELVNSLNTDSCIMALRNCFARRGVPVQIISDRGTNFIAAEKELKKALAMVDQDRMMNEFTSPTTSWVFNPPATPHMGGSWERLIQSVKKILSEMQLPHFPREEVLRSSLIEIENIVNSRPLTHVPIETESSPALTPNHFLVGSSNGLKPLVPFNDGVKALLQAHKTSQTLVNIFWRRWISEYLPTITRRTKWFAPVKPISVGDIVIIVDPKLPRNCWPKGRVLDTMVSKDGQVRQATVQTPTGIFQRSAVNLAVLDVGAKDSRPGIGSATGGGLLIAAIVRYRTFHHLYFDPSCHADIVKPKP